MSQMKTDCQDFVYSRSIISPQSYQTYPLQCTNRTNRTVPTVPTVPYQPYQPYRTNRTNRTVPGLRGGQGGGRKMVRIHNYVFVPSFGPPLAPPLTLVRYGWYGWYGTVGTVGTVRLVRLVRYGWYGWYSVVGTVGTVWLVRLVQCGWYRVGTVGKRGKLRSSQFWKFKIQVSQFKLVHCIWFLVNNFKRALE